MKLILERFAYRDITCIGKVVERGIPFEVSEKDGNKLYATGMFSVVEEKKKGK